VKDTLMGWTREQWVWVAEFLILRSVPLPAPTDAVDAASGVQRLWRERRPDDPAAPRLLLTNSIGQVFEQARPCSDASAWVRQLWANARRQIPLPYSTKDTA
jgi:hypothetical protein